MLTTLLAVGYLVIIPRSASADTEFPAEDGPQASAVCRQVVEINLFDGSWMRPSPEYWDGNWLRDAFWTTGFMGTEAGRGALDNFGAMLTAEGQAPTALGRNGAPNQFHDDESTLLYVIWAARDGGQPPDRISLAWKWVRGHVVDGAYWTAPGNFHTWHDTLVFPTSDVVAYNQGLYAAAALAAAPLGVAKPHEAEAAIDFYRQLYRPASGYVPASLLLDYHDSSVLAGEVLGRSLFGRTLLDDSMVISTVRALPRIGPGFMALSTRTGGYLQPEAFSPRLPQGHYQNGGSWLLYDVLAWTAARMAGDPEAGGLARQRLGVEVALGTLHEYLPTGPARAIGHPLNHVAYAGDSFACVAVDLPNALPSYGSAVTDTLYSALR